MDLHTTLTCKYCPDKIDNAEHTFFECARWREYRSSTEEIIGTRLSPSRSASLAGIPQYHQRISHGRWTE
ncbi:hypothetical protein J6590_097502, partial [Homalodisca vitripennis]